jgi:hypothetical protein
MRHGTVTSFVHTLGEVAEQSACSNCSPPGCMIHGKLLEILQVDNNRTAHPTKACFVSVPERFIWEEESYTVVAIAMSTASSLNFEIRIHRAFYDCRNLSSGLRVRYSGRLDWN